MLSKRKANDRAVRALLRLCRQRDDVVLVNPSWGEDTAPAKQMVGEAGAERKVVFLPYLASRPLLNAFNVRGATVIDEFVFGSYGLSTLGAMTCERAVISHIYSEQYRPYVRRLSPDLEARTENEIYDRMKWVDENPGALTAVGRGSRDWVEDQHSVGSVRILEEVMTERA